ncbi:MAG: peptidoglycan-binding protein, partial [Bacteroidia bacterium]|nr:peptidoglycan-binding protein [Bacteroidia bacterium]
DYGYYTVLPKEGFYRLQLKLGLSQEALEKLNPQLKEKGLLAGMVLKVPKDAGNDLMLESVEQTSLRNNLSNFRKKKLAVMLPFRLHRVDLDSIREAKDILQKDSYMSVSLDFHSGVLMALDSAKQLGISTQLDVFDTRARISEVSKILSSNNFSDYDAVIGPFTSDNFDRTAEVLKGDNVPVIAAVTMPKKLYSNVYQTIPSDEYLRRIMINYVKRDSSARKMIIIADSGHKAISDELKREFPSAKQIFSRKNKKGVEANYILISDIETEINEGVNVVFLETSNEGFVSNVTSMLSALNGLDTETNKRREIILMTTNKNKAFENTNVSNYDLSSLKFHYPSVNRAYLDSNNSFVENYERIYNSAPNKYAVRGFDLTMDILLRLASEEDLYKASNNDIETEYIENKFRYSKKLFGGYYNESAYIIKFDDLKIVEVKQ